MPTPAGTRHRVGDLLVDDGTWSLDGQRIVYSKDDGLYIAKSDGGEPRKLVTVPGTASWLRWSPDQRKLRLTVLDPKTQTRSLWEVSADGTSLHPLLPSWNSPPAECCGSWTPDGKFFVFQSARNGRADIWAIPEKGRLFQKSGGEPIQFTAARRAYAVRHEVQAVCALPLGDLGGRGGLFQGRTMGGLRYLSRSRAVAQQCGWQRKPSAHLSSTTSLLASVVSGRSTDCFRGQAAGWPLESLYPLPRRWATRANDIRGAQRN